MSKLEELSGEHEPVARSATESRAAWEQVREVRFQIAEEIDRMARELESQAGSWLRPVSIWLRGPAEYEQGLAQPMVLAICLPLSRKLMLRNLEMREKTEVPLTGTTAPLEESAPLGLTEPAELAELFSKSEIQQAVHWGFRQVLGRQKSVSRRVFGLLLYPLMTLLLAWSLWLAACFIFFPQVKESFEEMGFNLPQSTQLLLWMSTSVRDWWAAMILIPLTYVVLFFGVNYLCSSWSQNQPSWLDQKLMGRRSVIANWSWHLSLLLDWGLAHKSAVMVAGMCSRRGWLQQCSLDWIGESVDTIQNRRPKNLPVPNLARRFFSQRRFQLVNHAMALPDGKEKILLLREIGNYYQEKSSSFTEWMIALIAILLVWLSFGMIVMILFAIYSPLFQLLTGFL